MHIHAFKHNQLYGYKSYSAVQRSQSTVVYFEQMRNNLSNYRTV